jgi:GNAT superfamily N-acetyltransferase
MDRMAVLADVFVLPEHRDRGLGARLIHAMIEGGSGANFRWMLHTRDAQGLYAKFGFAPREGDRYLERGAYSRPIASACAWPTAARRLLNEEFLQQFCYLAK